MKVERTSVTLLLTLSLELGLIPGCRTSTQRTREARDAITISAENLFAAYESNEAEAQKRYQGKLLVVTGSIGTTVSPESGMGNPGLTLIDARQRPIVECLGFATQEKDAISKSKTGQSVSVKGKCMGKVVTDIPVLEDCVLQ